MTNLRRESLFALATLALLVFCTRTADAADWNATGGSVPDAPWSGDTPALSSELDVGELEGEGGVSGGSATYTIPIKVVPGRAGMQPSVSLNYSSSGGNGIAGMGWSLSASSAISRCGRTRAQDGVTDRVNFLKATDRLCYDGQRLVAVSGSYGNSGTEYRTEVDSFVKVVQSGDMDGTSTSFTVYHKNGDKDYFGQSSSSRHSLQGITKTSSWAISKSEDVSGNNTITYDYTSHGNGEYTLSAIHYTGQGAIAGDRHVEFVYETRTDVRNGFQSGGLWVSTKRLKEVITKYQSTVVRRYKLTYKQSATSGNSLLDSATECGYVVSVEHCLPATDFEWYENAPSYKFDRMHYFNSGGQKVFLAELASVTGVLPKKDMNGDGSLDWSTVFLDSEGHFKANNTYENLGGCHLNISTGQSQCHNADFNNDGLTDSWKVVGASSIKTFQYAYANYNGSNPVLTNTPITLNYSAISGESIIGLADLNGDGLTDVVVRRGIVPTSTNFGTSKVEVFLHTGNHAAPYTSTAAFVHSIPVRKSSMVSWVFDEDVQLLGDFDGNGIDDVFIFQKDATSEDAQYFVPQWHKPKFKMVKFSQPTTSGYSSTSQTYGDFMQPGFLGPSLPGYVNHDILFDINGDGLLDIMGVMLGTTLGYRINLGDGQISDWMILQNSATMGTKLKKGFVPVKLKPGSGGGPFGIDETYDEPRLAPGFVLDHDQNGRPEMLIPYSRAVSFCHDAYVVINSSGGSGIQTLCDDDMYRIGELASLPQPPIPDKNDRSIWEYYKAVFDVTGYSTEGVPIISVSLAPTEIVATISDGAAVDLYGNGLRDFATMISCNVGLQNTCSFGDTNGNNDLDDYQDAYGVNLTTGPYINRNTGSYGTTALNTSHYEVVDRMKSAETAYGNRVEWDFLPLNSGKGSSDFYTVDQSGLGSTAGYLHFSANVSVVSQARYSDGVGGLRSYSYKYRDATLSSNGRGFQGFEQIVVDDVANNLRSVSDFHIKFPLTGKLAEIRSCVISGSDPACTNLPITKTTSSWDLWRDGVNLVNVPTASSAFLSYVLEETTSENRYWVSPRLETVTNYRTTSSQSAGTNALQPLSVYSEVTHTTESETLFNSYGCSTQITNEYYEPAQANKNSTQTNTTYYSVDTAGWWLCRIDYAETTVNAVAGRTQDYADVEAGADFLKKTRSTTTWNTAYREPATETTTVTSGGGKPTKTTYLYNTFGLPTTVKVEGTGYSGSNYAMADRNTTMTYSSDNYFVATVTNAKGHVTTTVTDPMFGGVTSATDPNGQVATTTYDHFGRISSTKAPGEPTIRFGYWWCSGINGGAAWCPTNDHARYRIYSTRVGAPAKWRYFDYFDREIRWLLRDFANNNYYKLRRQYDDRGNLKFETNVHADNVAQDHKYTYYDGYDNLGRLTRVRKPQANDTHSQTDYSHDGFSTSIVANSYGVTPKTLNLERKNNGLGQLVWTKDADGEFTRYAYDGAGNPIGLEDALGNDITTKFNALGQKLFVHDPNSGDTDFGYNSLGELEWQEDANGDDITYVYDVLGRILDRKTNGVESGIWRYDNTSTYGRKGMLDYEWNTSSNTDRLIKYYRYATTSGGKDYLHYNIHYIYENGSLPSSNQHYTYYYVDNNFGRPKGVKQRTALTLAYQYNSLGYLTHVKNASSDYVYREVTAMDALGNVTGSLMGDGVLSQSQQFHPATGQMQDNHVMKVSGGSTVHRLEYDYEGFGNLYQSIVTASNGNQNYETFVYDNLHRLTQSDRAYTSVSRPNDVINYTYNEVGNILSKGDYYTSASYGNAAKNLGGNAGPNAVRQITYATGGTTNYSYDNNGNMLSGDGRSMSYNEFNKPLSITKSGVTSAFSYGADLMRYKQIKTGLSGGTQTTYYVDKLMEIEKQGTRTTYRHYLDGIAVLNREDVGSTTTWTLGFNLKDRLGGVVTLADENGNVLEHRSYDPFGKPRHGDFLDAASPTVQSAVGSDPITDRGFTDHEHLDEQSIIHMNGRVFDYLLGRFTSIDPMVQDPESSQGGNPYSYIMNNPLAGVDPTGYKAKSAQDKKGGQPKKDTEPSSRPDANARFARHAKYSGTMKRQTGNKRGIVTVTSLDNGGGTQSAGNNNTSTESVGNFDGTYAAGGGKTNVVADWNANPNRESKYDSTPVTDVRPGMSMNWPEGLESTIPVILFESKSEEVQERIFIDFILHRSARKKQYGKSLLDPPSIIDILEQIPQTARAASLAGNIDLASELFSWSSNQFAYALGYGSVLQHRSLLPHPKNSHRQFEEFGKFRLVDWTNYDRGYSASDAVDFYFYINHELQRPSKCFFREMCN